MNRLFKTIRWKLILSVLFVLGAASLAYAGGEGGGYTKDDWIHLAEKTFNFAILVGLIVWLLGKRMKSFFVDRRKDIKDSLENASTQKAEAEKQYREYSEKIDKASAEIDGIFEMIKAQGEAEKQKIIEDAHKVAAKMKEDSQARIQQELKKASIQLRQEAVQLSVEMAEDILKRNITAQDHEAMIKEYMDKVVNKH